MPVDPPPLGKPNETMRTCSRLVGMDGTRELLCGEPAVIHVIYHWSDEDYDHGFVCPDHWGEFCARWSCAGYHYVNGACGMPGSRLYVDRPCEFEDLPTAEPVRAVAELEPSRAR